MKKNEELLLWALIFVVLFILSAAYNSIGCLICVAASMYLTWMYLSNTGQAKAE